MSDLFDIPPDAPVDEDLVKDVEKTLNTLQTDMTAGKMQEMLMFQQSVAEGGPGSVADAVWNMMQTCKVGIRALARDTGIKRTKLVNMLEGRTAMPAEAISKIHDFFAKRRPDLFKDT